jgi:hypothetical protein
VAALPRANDRLQPITLPLAYGDQMRGAARIGPLQPGTEQVICAPPMTQFVTDRSADIRRYGRLTSATITFLWWERIDRQLQDDESLCAA